jgi:hypothetical protein
MLLSPNYLLILSSIYKRKINKIGEESVIVDNNLISFLKQHRADENDIKNWISANKTVLNQLNNINWVVGYDKNMLIGSYKNKSYYVYWYKSTARKDTVIIAHLIGSGNIKPLSVHQYIDDEGGLSHAHSKTIGHFGFLVPFIGRVIGTKDTQKLKETTEKFINDNRDTLNRIRSQFQTEPKELGRGSDGIAYSIGKDRVLKLFKSRDAYEAAVNAIQRLWKQPESAVTEAMIYDAGAFNLIGGIHHSYYYIIEKMQPAEEINNIDILIKELKEHAREIINTNGWNKFYFDSSVSSKIAPEIRQASEIIDRDMRQDQKGLILLIERQTESYNLKSNWLAKLVEEIIWKLITKRTDLGSRNLGITPNGEFRYFDPAYHTM